MTDMQPYEPTALARPDLLDHETDGWIATVADVARLAAYLCDTDFVPNGFRGNAPATAAAILYGREIGVPPLTALSTLHVIHGRVGMAAELMRARVLAAGHEVEFIETTAVLCRVRGRRRGSQTWTEVQWSKGDAQQAGLSGENWRKYPRAMLVARATAELCRLVFPDATHGMLSVEELDSDATTPAVDTAPAEPARKVARAKRTTTPPTAEAGGGTTGDPQGPVPPAPVAPPPGDALGAPPVVDPQTPPPGGQPPTGHDPGEVPDPAPPGLVPAPPVVSAPAPPLPGENDLHRVEVGLPLDMDPHDLEADPRAQAELRGDEPATQPQARHIMALVRKVGVETREDRLRLAQAVTQRRVWSFTDLTITEASKIITTLLVASESAQPRDYVRWLMDEGERVLSEREDGGGIGDE